MVIRGLFAAPQKQTLVHLQNTPKLGRTAAAHVRGLPIAAAKIAVAPSLRTNGLGAPPTGRSAMARTQHRSLTVSSSFPKPAVGSGAGLQLGLGASRRAASRPSAWAEKLQTCAGLIVRWWRCINREVYRQLYAESMVHLRAGCGTSGPILVEVTHVRVHAR